MIDQLNTTLNNVNKTVGIKMIIPKPTKSKLKLSRLLSTILGVGGLVIGITCVSKVFLVLGTVGAISVIAITTDIKKF